MGPWQLPLPRVGEGIRIGIPGHGRKVRLLPLRVKLIFLLDPSRFGLLPGDDPSMDPPCGPTLI